MIKEGIVGFILLSESILLLTLPIVLAECGDGICQPADHVNCKQDCSGATFFELYEKASFDRKVTGFCRQPTHCLVTPLGNIKKSLQPEEFFNAKSAQQQPRCITENQFILDRYCNNGEWVSRTAIVASTMLQLAPTQDFHLVCGRHNDIINRKDLKFGGKRLSEYLDFCVKGSAERVIPCVNNFCVMRFDDRVVLGTSYNIALDTPRGFLKALGQAPTICNAIADGASGNCRGESNGLQIFVDKKKDLIFAITRGDFPPGFSTKLPDDTDAFVRAHNNLFTMRPGDDFDVLAKIAHFDTLALRKQQGTLVASIVETNVEIDQIDLLELAYAEMLFPENPCPAYLTFFDRNAICQGPKQGRLLDANHNLLLTYKLGPSVPPISRRGGPAKGLITLWKDAVANIR